MNESTKSVAIEPETKVEEASKELALEVRRSRKVRTGIAGGLCRTQPGQGSWAAE